MANSMGDIIKDPDFWGPETTDDTRKAVLNTVPEFKQNYTAGQADIFLKNQRKAYDESQKREAGLKQQGAQDAQMGVQKQQTMWEKAVAPITNAVGMGMEYMTEPLVAGARLAQGEGMQALTTPIPRGAGGVAGQSRRQMAGAVVPQTPWQAGAMGVQFVPGMSAAGPMARVAGSMVAGGGLQGLLGGKGLLEGGSLEEAGKEAAGGVLKSGAAQASGEGVGKLLGGATRIPGTGRKGRIAQEDYKNVQKTVGEIAPELSRAGKTAAQDGTFYKGTKGAEEASLGAYTAKMHHLEGELNRATNSPYIKSPDLGAAFGHLQKRLGKNSVYVDQLQALKPNQGGFLPEQAKEILSLLRDTMKLDNTATGKFNQDALNNLVQKIEATLPASARGLFTAAREESGQSIALQELLGPAFSTGKGYAFDIRKLQEALSNNPDLINRIKLPELQKLFAVATRGASKGPGWADKMPGTNVSVPYPSWQGGAVATLRNLLQSGKHVGELPGTLSQSLKRLLGVAATSNVSSRSAPKE